MYTEKDITLIHEKGLTEELVNKQIDRFRNGFSYLKVISPATVGNGIISLNNNEKTECIYAWEDYLHSGGSVEKFVPASGAASRMFKDLYAFLDSKKQSPETKFEKEFFSNIQKFAFYDALNNVCSAKTGMNIIDLISNGNYSEIVQLLLNPEGLNYGNLPKALLQFHKSGNEIRTAIEEQLEEGAQHAKNSNNVVNIHFTVSPEHHKLFTDLIGEKKQKIEEKYGVEFNISMSEQKSSTDTIAVNEDNTPFRDNEGSLLFRPAGHGALIENLNERDSTVIFIKNIDNVVPYDKRDTTIEYKKALGGYLIHLQSQISKYLGLLRSGHYTINDLREIIYFMHNKLCVRYKDTKNLDDSELAIYLINKLDRPIRVCGVVKNDGEPGGGPFIAYNPDGSTSLQILESSQFDENDKDSQELLKGSTHFNPVDLVCYIKDIKDNNFDLSKFVDADTGFISKKSKDGKSLKALELPGLWNGAMSDWNTIFIEVPIETFNPVKTVNDLLRTMHQNHK